MWSKYPLRNRWNTDHRNIQAEHGILHYFDFFLIPHANNFFQITQLKLTVFHFKLSGTEKCSTKSLKKSSHTLKLKTQGSSDTFTMFYLTVWSSYF